METPLEKKIRGEIKKREIYLKNIEKASEKINKYFDSHPQLKKDVPEINFVVYNKITYPIIYEIKDFFYLGGSQLYMVLKSKCFIKNINDVYFYEVQATVQDIDMGKSPVIPIGCPADKKKIYNNDMGDLEIKV